MKKRLFMMVFILILIISFANINYAANITLEQIVSKFNNCESVKQYANYGSIWKASSDDKNINITIEANGNTAELEYVLEGNILSTSLEGDDAISGAMVSMVLIDCIGQLHGYSDGELFATLNSEEIQNYTLENEGIEIKQDTTKYIIKVDITKKIPLVDFSETYIEVSDLEDLKEFISGDGSAQTSKGNIAFWKGGYDNEMTVVIGEKEKLTENAYKSILSVLKVMFNSDKATNYFKENYSNISIGDKEFNGFKIEKNPTKTSMEEVVLGKDDTYQFVRITIDKSLVNSYINKSDETDDKTEQEKPSNSGNQIQDSKDEDTKKEEVDNKKTSNNTVDNSIVNDKKLPQTGDDKWIIISTVVLITLVGIVSYNKYKKYKQI